MRCKHCREKFEVKTFLQKFCRSNDECKTAEALKNLEQIKKKENKDWGERRKTMDVECNTKKYKLTLAAECQKLARIIDAKFGFYCIDCNRPFGNQTDGGHFNSKGKNMSIAYNLHNIHSQRSECNQNGLGGGRERQYYDGLVSRYGKEYAEMVDIGLQKKYKYIGLMSHELPNKIKIVRSIIRTFDTYKFKDSIQARETLNKIIGIYT